MQRVAVLVIAVAVFGCATESPPELDRGKVSYYDRNQDGRVDFEFHDTGGGDTDWAIADRDYDGSYDILLWYGMAGAAIYKHNAPILTGVKIAKGPVPVYITDYGQSVAIPQH